MPAIVISTDQALHFRAQRSHLSGPGVPTPAAAARSVVGVQAQQLEPALFALAQRTAPRGPSTAGERWTASDLKALLFGTEVDRPLVRTWGQRDTVHIYDPVAHWRKVIASRPLWPKSGRKGPMPSGGILEESVSLMRGLGRPATRKDLLAIVTGHPYTTQISEVAATARQTPEHFAAGRVLWQLAYDGRAFAHEKVGSEQTYGLRSVAYPDLAWPVAAPEDAVLELVRDYLRVYAPATAKDVAHHLGANATAAKAWLHRLEQADELLTVECDGRSGLWALRVDRAALLEDAPPVDLQGFGAWPLRLLPKFDTMLMGHADKGWTVPVEAERRHIWRRAAQVMATVVVRGRLVGTWAHKVRAKDVVVSLEPLSGWRASYKEAFHAEVEIFAHHLGRAKAVVKGAS